jgi:hypothetical protein
MRGDVPDTQDNLEVLGLGGREDLFGSVALAAGVGADQGGQVLQGLKVLLVILGGLAVSAGQLVAEGESEGTSGCDGRGRGQHERKNARNAHGGFVEART